MKIKTITCHDVYNVGASLQAYALVTYISNLGHDAEIIDYKPEYLLHYKLWKVNNEKYDYPILREIYNIAKLPGRIRQYFSKRKKSFDAFTKQYLPLTEIRYSSNEELKDNIPKADIYIAGSDQIWNTIFENGRDPAFYLDFAPKGAVRASYAASFSTEDVMEEWKPQVKEWLSNLDHISVREEKGLSILSDLGIKNAQHVMDPVFLLSQDEWKNIEKSVHIKKPYVLLYDFDNNKEIAKFAIKLAEKRGWNVYSVMKNSYCDKSLEQYGPREFIWLVHHAEFVVSNSFHATAFSILFHRQFVVFKRKEAINSRMTELLKSLELENHMFDVDSVTEKLSVIDYASVQKILARKIVKSKEYIMDVCSSMAVDSRN